MLIHEVINKKLKFVKTVTGHHHGQTDIRLSAQSDAGTVGYIDYSVYDGTPHINMIQVHQKRQGIGTELIKELQRDFAGIEIQWGSLTPLGTELYNSIVFDIVPNERVIRKKKQLAELKKKHDYYMKLHDQWQSSAKTQKDREKFLQLTADWNDIHDQIFELEQELAGQKEYTQLVKTS